jgi:ATP-binding cassette, subfamily B (MDR/TAP), member 1
LQLIFGSLSGDFQDYFRGDLTQSDFQSQLNSNTLYYVYLAIGEFITVYIATVGFNYAGERAACALREKYLAAVLSQNIAYFDSIGAGEITTSITSDVNLVQDGISEKVALTLSALSTTVTAFVISFTRYWKLTFILMSSVVAMFTVIFISGRIFTKHKKLSLDALGEGASFSEEVFSSIRNAVAFNSQEKLAKKYETFISRSERWGFRSQGVFGTMLAAILGIVFLGYVS